MNIHKEVSPAVMMDKILSRTVLGLLILIIIIALRLAENLMDATMLQAKDYLETILRVGVAIIILPPFLRFAWMKYSGKCQVQEDDSYIAIIFRRAGVLAFALTFVSLTLGGAMADKYFPELDLLTFARLITMLSLSLFCITYYYLIFIEGRDIPDEDEEELSS